MVAEGLEATIALEKSCLREPQKPPPSRTSGIGLWWLRNSMVAEALEATTTKNIMKGYMYILLCADGSYYTGSTIDLERRLEQHQNGEGANHTKKHLPVSLLYYEEYPRIDEAFYREKQVQGWSRKKKEALIEGNSNLLPELAIAYRDLKK